jgi:hypothetical protein
MNFACCSVFLSAFLRVNPLPRNALPFKKWKSEDRADASSQVHRQFLASHKAYGAFLAADPGRLSPAGQPKHKKLRLLNPPDAWFDPSKRLLQQHISTSKLTAYQLNNSRRWILDLANIAARSEILQVSLCR